VSEGVCERANDQASFPPPPPPPPPPAPRVQPSGPPTRLQAPPAGARAGWYRDPMGYPVLRYHDGRRWTTATSGMFDHRPAPAHPALDLRVAIGAVVVLLGSLVASRFLLEAIIEFEWPIAVFTAISIVIGYGPSMAWCWNASRRWGSGHLLADFGVRLRWVDLGWGPLTWLAAIGCELVALVMVQSAGIPLTSNTEGIGDLDADRTYVISLLVAAVVAAPFVEEVVFRGAVLRGLRSRMPAAIAVGLQGVLFGLAHVDPVRGAGNVGLVILLSAVGVAFGGAAYLLRRIGPAIIAHAVFNLVVMIVVLTDAVPVDS